MHLGLAPHEFVDVFARAYSCSVKEFRLTHQVSDRKNTYPSLKYVPAPMRCPTVYQYMMGCLVIYQDIPYLPISDKIWDAAQGLGFVNKMLVSLFAKT